MATPTLHTQVVGSAVTSVSFANATDVAAGDLLVVVWGSTVKAAGAITATATANSGAQTVATLTADLNADDGSRQIYVFSGIVTATPSTAVTITLTGAATSGTRRLFVQSVAPGTGQRWSSTRPSRSGSATGTAGGNPWTIPWGTAGASSQPEYALAITQFSSTQTPTIDPGDGTARTPTYPGVSAVFHILTIGYNGSTLQNATNASISQGSASSHAAGLVLYVTADPTQARGNAAAKGSATFKIIRKASGRGNAAAKAIGPGIKYTGVRTASGRANAAAKGSAIPKPKTASGRANNAATAWGEDPVIIHGAGGRANAAAKGTGRGAHGSKSSGRGNAAAKATAVGKHIIPIVASGRANAAAKATGHMYAPYHPAFLADFTNTLILDDGASSTVITDVGITITHVADDGHTTTLESQ